MRLFLAASLSLLPLLPLPAQPTPYPADASTLPGKGPVRVHPWFKDNRDYFWTTREKNQNTIVFVGDSLIGNWKELGKAFPGARVTNRGIGGDGTRSLLFRFKEDVMDLHPSAIVILIGTNDLSAHATIADILSNLSEILALVQKEAAGTPVIVCTVPPRNSPKAPLRSEADLTELNKSISSLADTGKKVAVLDLYTALANPDGTPKAEFFQADLLHLSAGGYAKFQEVVHAKLKGLGIL